MYLDLGQSAIIDKKDVAEELFPTVEGGVKPHGHAAQRSWRPAGLRQWVERWARTARRVARHDNKGRSGALSVGASAVSRSTSK